MPDIYCRRCHHLMHAAADHCPKCKTANREHPAFVALGRYVLSAAVGAAVAAAFVRLLYLSWPRWEKRFEGTPADEVALVAGGLVFLLATAGAAVAARAFRKPA